MTVGSPAPWGADGRRGFVGWRMVNGRRCWRDALGRDVNRRASERRGFVGLLPQQGRLVLPGGKTGTLVPAVPAGAM